MSKTLSRIQPRIFLRHKKVGKDDSELCTDIIPWPAVHPTATRTMASSSGASVPPYLLTCRYSDTSCQASAHAQQKRCASQPCAVTLPFPMSFIPTLYCSFRQLRHSSRPSRRINGQRRQSAWWRRPYPLSHYSMDGFPQFCTTTNSFWAQFLAGQTPAQRERATALRCNPPRF